MSTPNAKTDRAGGAGKLPFLDGQLLRLIVLFLGILLAVGFTKNWIILSGPMVRNMLFQMPEFGIIALGIMMTRISGRIDLSVVGTANLAAILAAYYMRDLIPVDAGAGATAFGILVALAIAFLVGVLCGAFNGFLIYYMEIPAFVATIGTGTLYTGIGLILTKGTTISGIPDAYQQLVTMTFGPIPLTMILYVLCALLMAFLLYKTRFGLSLYLSGTNMHASRYAGVDSLSIIFRPYIIAGCMSVLGGLIMLGRFNSVNASNGSSYSLMGVLICMIGGINPAGGQGRVEGVVLATMTIQLINSSLSLYHSINSFYNKIVFGGLLILFMVLNHYMDIQQERKLSRRTQGG